ncbi:DUF1127 domain-containing protein [Rhizobium sp. G187]|uniref:DUF1127 domain-containing protein n=1 Tax=Rhizobium sp. G187 TaxID=3451352 RepID=UPI003EE745BF
MRTTDRIFDLELVYPARHVSAADRVTRVSNVIRTVFKAIRNRLAVNKLGDLDDRLLADIGLSRSEISQVLLSHGISSDPSPILKHLARARAEQALRAPRSS